MTLTLTRPWSNIGTAHCLIILDICAQLFVNPTRGSKDIERTRNTVRPKLKLSLFALYRPTRKNPADSKDFIGIKLLLFFLLVTTVHRITFNSISTETIAEKL